MVLKIRLVAFLLALVNYPGRRDWWRINNVHDTPPSIATFHETYGDENKAGNKQSGHTKSRTYTQLSSSLHQKKGARMRGTAQRKTRTIKTNRKREETSLVGQWWSMHFFFIKDQRKWQECIYKHKGKTQRPHKRGGMLAQHVQVQNNPGTNTVCLRSDSAGTNHTYTKQSTF